jgi:hypothetical protein
MEIHLLHVVIGKIFENTLPKSYILIKDEASGGPQRIPLFTSEEKSRETWYCDVDLLVLKEDKIKIIVEIEESDLGPTQVCGKYLTSALSRYYIHESMENRRIEMDDEVTFIQIMDATNLNKEKTKKFGQWKNLEKSIRPILPVKGSNVTNYALFYGTVYNFKKDIYAKELADFKKHNIIDQFPNLLYLSK